MVIANDATVRQQGAALITALLIVAMATSVVVGMVTQQHVDIRRSGNIMDRDRSLQVALGGEGWAMGILLQDANEGSVDHLNELWALDPPPIPVTGGTALGRISDLQGRFNLNNLLLDGKPSGEDLVRFERLLMVLNLDPRLAMAVVDWLDPDGFVAGFGGAEDETYLGKDPPYRTANQPMLSVTELYLIEGFDHQAVEKLLPFVAALPVRTKLNINTAPVELLMTMMESMPRAAALDLADKQRRDYGFLTVEDFLAQSVFKDKKVLSADLTLASSYFLVDSQVEVGRGRMRLLSLLFRRENRVRVVRRGEGVL